MAHSEGAELEQSYPDEGGLLYTAPHNKTCAFVQRLLGALKINLEIKVW